MAPFGWVSGRRRRPFGRSTPWWRGSSAAPAGVSLSLPLHPRAECQGHGRQQRQGHGEARQVRLHDTTSWIEVCAVPPATGRSSQGRSLALRPRLTTGLPWTVVHRGASIAPTRTLDGGGPAGHRPLVPRSDAARVSAATHQGGRWGQAAHPDDTSCERDLTVDGAVRPMGLGTTVLIRRTTTHRYNEPAQSRPEQQEP